MSSQGATNIATPVRNVIGFDDGPPGVDGRVPVVGAVYCDERLDGVLTTSIEADGDDVTEALVRVLVESRFHGHVGAILLQGVTFGGFNVVDAHALSAETGRAVIVVCRRNPDRTAIRDALVAHFPDGERRFGRIQALPPPSPIGSVLGQWLGLDDGDAAATLRHHCRFGHMPEPLRVAHLIAGAVGEGHSRGRA